MEKYYLMYVGVLVVETTLLWASVERDMLDKKMIMKFFSWWSVAHCARSSMLLLYVSRDRWNTSHGYCDWWRIQPIEMDHAVWPSVGMES